MILNDNSKKRIFVPLDTPSLDTALQIIDPIKDLIAGAKIGKELFSAVGPDGFLKIAELEIPIFADLKFHDIPNTVAGAVRSMVKLKPAILNVHAQGGRAMLKAALDAAKEEANKLNITPPLMLGVTVLTSLSNEDMAEIGINGTTLDQVKRLTVLSQEVGLDGVVCSAAEIAALRKICDSKFKLVTPGIRPSWSAPGDQKRVVTPGEAIKNGADYIVVGRPIYNSSDPVDVVNSINSEIELALA